MVEPQPIASSRLLGALSPEWPEDLLPAIRAARRAKVVVLDDDPTGTQTVYGVPVLTDWSVPALQDELANDLPAFFILTNSRSLPLAEAQARNAVIGSNLAVANARTGRSCTVVSRSDSTLRGHFPGEVYALETALGGELDAWLLVPFFLEGGRYTVGNVHYVAEGDMLIPAGQTEFARDRAFEFHASDLRAWVEEKTAGRVPADTVATLSIEDLRQGGPLHVAQRLLSLPRGAVCLANAASYRDLQVLTLGLMDAEGHGKRYLCRTAASFVPVRAGLAPRPLLAPSELGLRGQGAGLIVVGSHVARSSTQLDNLLARPDVVGIEVGVQSLLDRPDLPGEVARRVDEGLAQGADVVIYTSRQLIGEGAAASLAVGRRVSAGLVAIVQSITARPRYLLAKGGITSSDLATAALGVRRAMVLGQILPGVPVWQLGPDSRHPGLPYIVFPGNVGGPQALADVVEELRGIP